MIGAEHRRIDRPNQDAWAWRRRPGALVAVVADGCGSGGHSEVGARLGAALWAEALCRRAVSMDPADPVLYREARRDVAAHLRVLAAAMGGDLAAQVSDCFLFTLLGCVVARGELAIHALGDGLFAIDGEVRAIGPFADNRPPYLGYDICGPSASEVEICATRPATEVDSIALATDGAAELDDLAAFAADPRMTRNRDAIRRRLALINREVIEPDWEAGRLRRSRGALADDTTVLVIRKLGRRGPARAGEVGALARA